MDLIQFNFNLRILKILHLHFLRISGDCPMANHVKGFRFSFLKHSNNWNKCTLCIFSKIDHNGMTTKSVQWKLWHVCCLHFVGCVAFSCPGVCSPCCYTPLSGSPRHFPAASASQRAWRHPSCSVHRSYCTRRRGSGWSLAAAVPETERRVKLRSQ